MRPPFAVIKPLTSKASAISTPSVESEIVPPVNDRLPNKDVLSERVMEPLPESITMSPVVELPKARVCLFVVPNTPRPVKVVALLPEFAEIDAVGVPEFTLRTANLAEAVEVPPIKRSRVEANLGNIVPDVTFQLVP